MTYSIRIQRGQDGHPEIVSHGGELPGTITITGHEDQTIQSIAVARVDDEEHQVLTAHAQRPPEPRDPYSGQDDPF